MTPTTRTRLYGLAGIICDAFVVAGLALAFAAALRWLGA